MLRVAVYLSHEHQGFAADQRLRLQDAFWRRAQQERAGWPAQRLRGSPHWPLFSGVDEYLNRFRFYNPANGLCFEDVPEEIYTIELCKVPAASDGTDVWEWVRFILAQTGEEIEMLAQRNPEIRKGADALYKLSADPDMRARLEEREKAWKDNATWLNDAFENGREKERGVWQGVVVDKDVIIANASAENERLRAQIAELQAKQGG